MKAVEITYRYAGDDAAAREHLADAEAARRRMDEGNRAFADLFAWLDARSGTPRRIIRVDRRDLGLLPAGTGSPHQ
jgi:hypothetical protein